MKKVYLLSGILVFAVSVLMTSCGPSRGYYSQSPPRVRTSLTLIISPTPGFVMSRHPDGRYFYRSPEGFIYWRGYDNRFYLDRSYIGRVHYSRREYNDWRYYDRGYNRRRHR